MPPINRLLCIATPTIAVGLALVALVSLVLRALA
jgi:hypothetical protein